MVTLSVSSQKSDVRSQQSEVTSGYADLNLKYILDIPRCDASFLSTAERTNGRLKLFLIFNEKGNIYIRDGIRGVWLEITSPQEYSQIRELLDCGLNAEAVPHYTSNHKIHLQ
jgi:hypothetical protein